MQVGRVCFVGSMDGALSKRAIGAWTVLLERAYHVASQGSRASLSAPGVAAVEHAVDEVSDALQVLRNKPLTRFRLHMPRHRVALLLATWAVEQGIQLSASATHFKHREGSGTSFDFVITYSCCRKSPHRRRDALDLVTTIQPGNTVIRKGTRRPHVRSRVGCDFRVFVCVPVARLGAAEGKVSASDRFALDGAHAIIDFVTGSASHVGHTPVPLREMVTYVAGAAVAGATRPSDTYGYQFFVRHPDVDEAIRSHMPNRTTVRYTNRQVVDVVDELTAKLLPGFLLDPTVRAFGLGAARLVAPTGEVPVPRFREPQGKAVAARAALAAVPMTGAVEGSSVSGDDAEANLDGGTSAATDTDSDTDGGGGEIPTHLAESSGSEDGSDSVVGDHAGQAWSSAGEETSGEDASEQAAADALAALSGTAAWISPVMPLSTKLLMVQLPRCVSAFNWWITEEQAGSMVQHASLGERRAANVVEGFIKHELPLYESHGWAVAD